MNMTLNKVGQSARSALRGYFRHRSFVRVALPLAVAGAIAVPAVIPATAAATATRCGPTNSINSLQTCLKVVGSSNYVSSVQVEFNTQIPLYTIDGNYHVWGAGLNFYVHIHHQYILPGSWWAPVVGINKYLTPGQVCEHYPGDGGNACVNIL